MLDDPVRRCHARQLGHLSQARLRQLDRAPGKTPVVRMRPPAKLVGRKSLTNPFLRKGSAHDKSSTYSARKFP